MVAESKSLNQPDRPPRRTLVLSEAWVGRLGALERLAEHHQEQTTLLLRDVRELPRLMDEMAESAQREIDHQVAAVREAHQRSLRHLRQDLVACDAELARVSGELADARAAVARLAARLSNEINGSSQAAATPGSIEPRRLTSVLDLIPDDAALQRSGVILSVRGVSRATLGLSIREHLQRLPYIEDVALSDFADATLHLTVVSRRPILLEDALAWEHLLGLHIASFRPDQIEAEVKEVEAEENGIAIGGADRV